MGFSAAQLIGVQLRQAKPPSLPAQRLASLAESTAVGMASPLRASLRSEVCR